MTLRQLRTQMVDDQWIKLLNLQFKILIEWVLKLVTNGTHAIQDIHALYNLRQQL